MKLPRIKIDRPSALFAREEMINLIEQIVIRSPITEAIIAESLIKIGYDSLRGKYPNNRRIHDGRFIEYLKSIKTDTTAPIEYELNENGSVTINRKV